MRIEEVLHPKFYSPRYWVAVRRTAVMSQAFAKHLGTPASGAAGKVLLDFGCGRMPYKAMLAQRVARYIGVDVPAVKDADCHVDLATGRVPLEDSLADVILSTQVLEHVPDPAAYLAECRRLSKSDGLLILTTHGWYKHHPNPEDYWRWTGQGLRRLAERCGWEILDFEGIVGYAGAALQFFQDACLQRMPGFLRRPFCALTQLSIRLADACYRPEGRRENAVSFLIVGRLRADRRSGA